MIEARFSRSHPIVFSIALIIASVSGVAAEPIEAKTQIVTATVTDREDNPIEGAQVVRLNWFGKGHTDAPVALTNAEGEFQFAIQPTSNFSSNYVVIYKEGYAVGALNLDSLPARARLWPKKPVALRIVDADQDPVPGARVTLDEVGFDDEFLHANVPPALSEPTGAISRHDGWAILRSTRPEFLHSVAVQADGYGSQSFAASFSESRFNVLQLWETTPVSVKVMEGDRAASGWTVVATSSEVLPAMDRGGKLAEKNPLNGNLLPKGIAFTGKTNEDGRVELPHALLRRRVHLLLLDTNNRWRGSGSVVAVDDANTETTLHARPSLEAAGTEYTGRVVDDASGDPIAGVEVSFITHEMPPENAKSTSDNDGRLTAKLIPGQWHVSISKVPDGYCKTFTSNSAIVIPEQGEYELPTMKVPKGKVIEGKIQGIDLAIRRARWIHVSWSDAEADSGTIYGRFQPDGRFRVTIPETASPDTFAIVAIGGGNDVLMVESKDPLVLTSSGQE